MKVSFFIDYYRPTSTVSQRYIRQSPRWPAQPRAGHTRFDSRVRDGPLPKLIGERDDIRSRAVLHLFLSDASQGADKSGTGRDKGGSTGCMNYRGSTREGADRQARADRSAASSGYVYARIFRGNRSPCASQSIPYRSDITMRIEYFHASKYGNGAMVAEEFKKVMASRGAEVEVHHFSDAKPKSLPQGGTQPASARLAASASPSGTGPPVPEQGRTASRDEIRHPDHRGRAACPTRRLAACAHRGGAGQWQRVRPIMNDILAGQEAHQGGRGKVLVTGMKGPLEEGWQ